MHGANIAVGKEFGLRCNPHLINSIYFRNMKSQEIINKLREEMPVMKAKFGVEEIGLFGSYARNEIKIESDLDLLVKLREPSFLKLATCLISWKNYFI